ncbi:MAG: zinc ribbon-containing protein [Methyloglobulus sp.]|nr:zinc ribbon-containing protein [Methyloglobulus sp.]
MAKNKFVTAYTDLMEHLYLAMDNSLHSMADAWDIAKAKMGKAGELTQEEINIISDALKRDIESAAHGLPGHQDANSLSEWFKFDIDLIENFTLDAFLSLADKTRIELAKLGEEAKHHTYQSGDITLPGTFTCDQCSKEIAFKTPSQIPECPACHCKTFTRI